MRIRGNNPVGVQCVYECSRYSFAAPLGGVSFVISAKNALPVNGPEKLHRRHTASTAARHFMDNMNNADGKSRCVGRLATWEPNGEYDCFRAGK